MTWCLGGEERLLFNIIIIIALKLRKCMQGRRHRYSWYQFLRRKNGVAGILTYERVASYIQSFHLEASAGQSRDHKVRTDCSMLSRVLVSDRIDFHCLGTRPTHTEWRQAMMATFKQQDARDVATLPANLHFPFHVESETVTESSGNSAVQST